MKFIYRMMISIEYYFIAKNIVLRFIAFNKHIKRSVRLSKAQDLDNCIKEQAFLFREYSYWSFYDFMIFCWQGLETFPTSPKGLRKESLMNAKLGSEEQRIRWE